MPRPSRWNEIVAAAALVFESKGYGGASLEDIAQEVGITKGTLYHYIESKEDLLIAVIKPPAERLLREVRQLAAEDLPASERIRRIAHVHAEIVHDLGTYVAVYLNEVAGRGTYDEWADRDDEYVRTVQKIIEDGIERGDFARGVDPQVVTMTLIGALNWLTRWYKADKGRSAHQLADAIANVTLSGLLSRTSTTSMLDPVSQEDA